MKVVVHYRRLLIVLGALLQLFLFFLGRLSAQLGSVEQQQAEVAVHSRRRPPPQGSTYLLVLVMSRPEDFLLRQTVRDTWLRLSTKTPSHFIHRFPIGLKGMDKLNTTITNGALLKEQSSHNDLILLPDLTDTYERLATKTALSIRAVVGAYDFKFLLKADIDSFVRLGALLQALRDIQHPRLYWGFLDGRARPFRKGKWREKEWILCDRYLPYQLGGGYVISRALATFIADNVELLKFYRNEDVSMGAWLAGLDVKYVHDPRFDTESTSRGCHNEYLISHRSSPAAMKAMFANLREKGVLCTQEFQQRQSYVYDFAVPPSECCQRRNGTAIP